MTADAGGPRGDNAPRRELCQFCNRKVDVLPTGRLAYHHYVAPGIGIPCPGVPANGTRSICSRCAREDIGTDLNGRIHHHYIRPKVKCAGAGKLPEIAA